jgi:hypothetical protein
LTESLKRAQEALLHYLACLVVVAQDCARCSIETLAVPVEENFEERGLTVEHSTNELLVR